jgi:hypothetical protein
MARETALYRDDVEQVRRRWAEWRSAYAVRSRLPEDLWAAAVELVQRDGIDATASVPVSLMPGRTANFWGGENCALQASQVRKLYRAGVGKSEIARRLRIGRTSVRRIPEAKP